MATRFFMPNSMRTDYKCTFIRGFKPTVVVIFLGDEEPQSSPVWKNIGRCRSRIDGRRFPAWDRLRTNPFATIAALPPELFMGLRDGCVSDRGGGKRRWAKAIRLGHAFAHAWQNVRRANRRHCR